MSLRRTAEGAIESLARADAKVEEIFDPHREDWPVKALGFVGKMGDQPQLRLLSAGCLAAGLLMSDRRLVRAGTRMLLAHEIATLAKSLVKDSVDRTRPRNAQSMAERQPRAGRSSDGEETSFPSGHTAGSLAVARAFSREFPEHRGKALACASIIAAAQVPKCAHYVSDVGAGAVVGLLSEASTSMLWSGGAKS